MLPERIPYVIADEAHSIPDALVDDLKTTIGPGFGSLWAHGHSATIRQVHPGPGEDPISIRLRTCAEQLIRTVNTVRDALCAAVDWDKLPAEEKEYRVYPNTAHGELIADAIHDYNRGLWAWTTGRMPAPGATLDLPEPKPARAADDDAIHDFTGEGRSVPETIERLAAAAHLPSVVAVICRAQRDTIELHLTKVERTAAHLLGPRAAQISATIPATQAARTGWRDITPVDVGHPFDHRNRVRGLVSRESGAKWPRAGATPAAKVAFYQALPGRYQARAAEADRFIGGHRALVLTPSYNDIDVLGRYLVPLLAARGIPVFLQPRNEGSKGARQATEAYRAHLSRHGGPAVLIGTDSLTTGLDLPGDLLTHVVLWCVPYGWASPVDAQLDRDYPGYLDQRVRTKFVQGVGRLLRTVTDSGAVLLSDYRFVYLLRKPTPLDRHLSTIDWRRCPIHLSPNGDR